MLSPALGCQSSTVEKKIQFAERQSREALYVSGCKWAQVINTLAKDSLERDNGVFTINTKPSQS